jgi:hypothetical protein
MARLKALRIAVIVTVILLAFQFELGMAVNLSPNLQEVPPLAGTLAAIWAALSKVGGDAVTHALLGGLLTILAAANLVLALASRSRSAGLIGALSFLSIALASVNGVLFTLSGFKNDNYSHGMATTFLVAFSLHFIQLGFLTIRVRKLEGRPHG